MAQVQSREVLAAAHVGKTQVLVDSNLNMSQL